MKAMRRAANEAYKKHYFEKILVDGPYFNGYIPAGEDSEMIPHECIIKGDSKYINIAAASILANNNPAIKKRLNHWRLLQTKSVKKKPK